MLYNVYENVLTLIFFNITNIFLLSVTVSKSIIDTDILSNKSIHSPSIITSMEFHATGSFKEEIPFSSVLLKGH